MAFKVLCVDHVGVAVNDLALIKKQMKDLLNLEPSLPDETVEDNIVEALAALPEDAKLDKHWRVGAGGCHIAFMHPKATGLLLELTERPGGPSF